MTLLDTIRSRRSRGDSIIGLEKVKVLEQPFSSKACSQRSIICKKKLSYTAPELGERVAREVSWRDTNDVNYPWSTEISEETWRVGLNDFPDDLIYTLTVNDKIIGKFHRWPERWHR